MLYILEGTDAPNATERRAQARPAHLARVQQLVEAGRVVVGGPIPAVDSNDPSAGEVVGSVIIAEFDSLESARAWWALDPYVLLHVFQKTSVRPFRQVVP
jgi:hypothetical protein